MKKGILSLVIYFVVQNIIAFIIGLLLAAAQVEMTIGILMMINLYALLIAGVLLWLLFRKELKEQWQAFKLQDNKIITTIVYYGMTYGALIVSGLIINLVNGGEEANNQALLNEGFVSVPIIMIIFTVFIAPFVEEMVFRFGLRRMIKNKYIFIIVSSLVFGLLHTSISTNIKQMIYLLSYGSMGAVFSICYVKENNIFNSILVHMLNNAISVILIFLTMYLI